MAFAEFSACPIWKFAATRILLPPVFDLERVEPPLILTTTFQQTWRSRWPTVSYLSLTTRGAAQFSIGLQESQRASTRLVALSSRHEVSGPVRSNLHQFPDDLNNIFVDASSSLL